MAYDLARKQFDKHATRVESSGLRRRDGDLVLDPEDLLDLVTGKASPVDEIHPKALGSLASGFDDRLRAGAARAARVRSFAAEGCRTAGR
ncbi:hypothetical protein ATY79_00410 [Rhizobium sp. R693]|nr:hypothetical protein ATY79_00410 [Rhizobium sp. R693]